MQTLLKKLAAISFSAVFCSSVAAEGVVCRVVGVSDGDTITALCGDSKQLKVRLAEIDAPEKAQPFGQVSKKSLSDLCFGKQAEIATHGLDRYGRSIGRVSCDGTDANAEQVRRGLAWVYDKYVTDLSLYPIQTEARQEHRGLWSEKSPVPPWEWRRTLKAR